MDKKSRLISRGTLQGTTRKSSAKIAKRAGSYIEKKVETQVRMACFYREKSQNLGYESYFGNPPIRRGYPGGGLKR